MLQATKLATVNTFATFRYLELNADITSDYSEPRHLDP